MNHSSLAAALAYLVDNATNDQKQSFFETLESESGAGFGEGLSFTYEVWKDENGREHLECCIEGITSFTFHYP